MKIEPCKSTEIKPCPYCGSEELSHVQYPGGSSCITCEDCEAEGPVVHDEGEMVDLLSKAREKWNQRDQESMKNTSQHQKKLFWSDEGNGRWSATCRVWEEGFEWRVDVDDKPVPDSYTVKNSSPELVPCQHSRFATLEGAKQWCQSRENELRDQESDSRKESDGND